MKPLEIGLQTYTIREFMADPKQLEESLKKVKEIGYKNIQMGTPAYMSTREYKSLLDKLGMKTCSSNGNYENMLENPSTVKDAAEKAQILETGFISIGTIPAALRGSKEGYKQFALGMNQIGGELKKAGLKLSYHSHALEFAKFNNCTGMDILACESDPESVYFCVDTHWIHAGGKNPTDYIRSLKGRVTLVHFKDYVVDDQVARIEQVNKHFAEIGEGNLDWPKIIDACCDSGTEVVIVEQDICKGSPFESIKISYDNLKRFGL